MECPNGCLDKDETVRNAWDRFTHDCDGWLIPVYCPECRAKLKNGEKRCL